MHRQIESGPLFRGAEIEKRAIDPESRTAELAFSSETPVERWFGDEILDHHKESIRLDRMSAGGPLLMDHQTSDHIGTVESVSVGADRVARAKVRFGKSARAEEIWADVQDGIRKHVSVGYRIHRMQLDETSDDGDVYRATDWEPYEISLVSVPADASVGIGRSESGQRNTILIDDNREEKTMAEKLPAVEKEPEVDVQAITNQARDAEIKRIRDLENMGEKYADFGGTDLAREMIREGKTLADMKDAVLDRLPEVVGSRQESVPASNLDMEDKEKQRYSLFRAVNAHLNKDWSKAGFELECSREIAERINKDPQGFFVPLDVLDGQRVMTTSAGGTGLKGTEHLAGSFIDALRAQSVAMSLGATVLDGLVGDVSIPKLTAGGTFYWVAEDGNITDGDGTIGSVTLSPKTIGAAVPISRKLLKQSAPSIEQVMLNDLRQGAALGIDLAALEGGGVNEPVGIINTTGVNTQAIAASAGTGYPTWAELVGFESAVGNDNALEGSLAYVTTSAIAGGMKVTAKDAGSGLFLMENNMANGYPVAVRNGLTAKSIVFGNFNDLLIGMWGVLDVMPDEATKAASGGLVLRVFQDVDVAVRHAESFCINA